MTITAAPATTTTTDATTATTAAASDTARFVRRTGVALAAGAAIWAGAMAAYSPQTTDPVGITVVDLGALPFQGALFALVTAQLRTAATGTSRFARGMLRLEYVLLALATLWTVLHGAFWSLRGEPWLAVLDAFWPLSMLGMFAIGVKIAFAKRWTGPLRGWPLVAESWAVVSVPALVIFGVGVGQAVGSLHALIGYGGLGLLLALRPHLTGAR
ncbi:hypothetical protein [Spirilliplanes yamanashiensis]|uniref:Uncharacterized protein n=1 Tax=Spirilliplanes yamanashiensis TaxID=42233 RepID=A0A8J4DKJ9_9ACTN|nr:hypothetical protein [Spirilliplanes yamanashiensis]MDP9818927.1 hypothetical protein [Spirilliplanes yamanashiensis]GIJ05382.1 hypothetical protein Sya03_47340 [Spirilliplanes yamanashiensis]